jgi:hypothetical protein
MANMSYCRFRNTYGDLLDCAHALEDANYDVSDLSQEEQTRAWDILKLCNKMLNNAPADLLEQLNIEGGEVD